VRVVLDDLRAENLLGEGASGGVYAARLEGVDVAIKVLRASLAGSERGRARFLAEAERMARVSHRAIVRILDSGSLDDGRPYLVMPRLSGETLAARLRRGPLAVGLAVSLFVVLADAVGALHAAGLVHRDVKPDNVFLVDGQPVLLDLGIAKELDGPLTATTAEGLVRGTPAYMAPERFFGGPATVASDVYELAVVLYEMLTAHIPWGDSFDPAARRDPATPSSKGTPVPPALEAALLRALSTRPEVRPRSARALAAAAEAGARGAASVDVRQTADEG
jgi:serine/threonine protein kinase